MNSFECGKVANTHGVRGELKIECYCDEALFQQVQDVFIGGKPYHIVSLRPHGGFALLTVAGVSTVEQAMPLKGQPITADRDAIHLPAGQCFYSDLYGFSVLDLRLNRVIGTLKRVQESPAAMLYCVDVDGREVLIPAVPAFQDGFDLSARVLRLRTIEGMLPDEN